MTLNPHSLADVCADIRAVGEATGSTEQANALVADFERDIASVEKSVAGLDRPRVLCLEWLDPPYVAGHWVPEMVERAGGTDVLGQAGKPSYRVEWEAALAARPEVIVIMPCGYTLAAAEAEFRGLPLAARDGTICRRCASGRVFVVEASGYFSRPGPRLAAGMEILAAALMSGNRSESCRSNQENSFLVLRARIVDFADQWNRL